MAGLQEQYFQVLEQIDQLGNFHGDSLGQRELIDIIEQRLARFDAAVRLAEYTAQDSDSSILQAQASELRQSVRLGYRRFQAAQRGCQQSQQEHWRAQREKLYSAGKASSAATSDSIGSGTGGGNASTAASSDEPAVSKSEDITATLRRVHQMAQGEVLKAEINVEELDASTKTLRDLEDRYTAVDVLLTGSRKLVKLLDEADRGDRRRMQLALSFLAAVVLWILWRRIFKLPAKLLWFGIVRLVRTALWVSSSVSSTTESSLSSLPIAATASTLAALSVASSDPLSELSELSEPQTAETLETSLETPSLEALEAVPEPVHNDL